LFVLILKFAFPDTGAAPRPGVIERFTLMVGFFPELASFVASEIVRVPFTFMFIGTVADCEKDFMGVVEKSNNTIKPIEI
jgi:hypothetical protein